jgi:protein involved in polysaccharide export with SLBB domain
MSQKAIAAFALMIVAGFAGCAATARAHASHPTWTAADAEGRIFPGDELDVQVWTAPELSRTVKVGPDGRILMPLAAPVMAADRTPQEIERALTAALMASLRDPRVSVTAKHAPRQVFVGGEVARPGIYDLPAGADALQAILLAGGFTAGARRDQVVMLRRGEGGQQLTMTMDLRSSAIAAGRADSAPPLQRMDVIVAPKKPVAQVGAFMQTYVREALPIQFSAVYDVARIGR